jgi:FkbH-like protein
VSSAAGHFGVRENGVFEEDIRLVIWDLDDTFWRGALIEGGVKAYLSAHHEIVVELARRGVMSSICSKNEYSEVKTILIEKRIWEYFVFPSIDWSAKGRRISRILEAMQLRAATTLFIDDNPGNRAEARHAVPGLNVADVDIIPQLLSHPKLAGKDDSALSRLGQYKLLERKASNQAVSGGSYEAFLRDSDIQVELVYELEPHLDRIVELVNRTNQLNYTKRRLPQDRAAAIGKIRAEISSYSVQAGLVHVTDKYGDYGLVGFFARSVGQDGSPGRLLHYCFSCRTLGMFVEKWLYDLLGRPELTVGADALTDLSGDREIDWIRIKDATLRTQSDEAQFPLVYLRGGCEIDALSHYFSAFTSQCLRESSIARGPFFVRKDVAAHMLVAAQTRDKGDWSRLIQDCGFHSADFETKLFSPCPDSSVLIYSGWADNAYKRYRHIESGQTFLVDVPSFPNHLTELSEAQIEEFGARRGLSDDDVERVKAAARTLKSSTDFIGRLKPAELVKELDALFAHLPTQAICFALAMDPILKDGQGRAFESKDALTYNECLAKAAGARNVEVVHISDFVTNDGERRFANHYDRIVYYRLAGAIISRARARAAERADMGGAGVGADRRA